MKKKLLAVMVVGSTVFTTNLVHAADGTVKFTGNIIDNACTVDASGKDQTVQLGNVAATSFSAAGDISAGQKFDIKLTGCPEGNVAVVFNGSADSANTDLLKLDSGMTATGVAVRINNEDGTQVKLNDASSIKQVEITDTEDSATLSYVGQYQATNATVTAGTANATSQFTVLYN